MITLFGGDIPVTKAAESSFTAPEQWLLNWANGGAAMSGTGIAVNDETAMRQATVYACVKVISESLAQLPLSMYRTDGDDRVEDLEHPVTSLIYSQPNSWQTSFEWRQMLCADLLTRGNAYSEILTDRNAIVRALEPIPAKNMRVLLASDGELYYEFPHRLTKETVRRHQSQILHLRGLSRDGYLGLSPIQAYREAVGIAQAAEQFSASLFKNGASIGGFVKVPQQLTADARAALLKWLEHRHQGFANAYKIGLLDANMDWVPTNMTPSDAEFVNLRKMQREEICSIFRVPPHMAGDLSRSTNNNIEQQALEFVQYTLGPWVVSWEQALMRDLLSRRERVNRTIKFNVNALLRGDMRSRGDLFAKARQWGWMSVNDIRRAEEMNGIGPDGDRYLEPINMIQAGETPSQQGGANAQA